ncbi:MAG: ABC transporter substrate-binding protein [bacterium]
MAKKTYIILSVVGGIVLLAITAVIIAQYRVSDCPQSMVVEKPLVKIGYREHIVYAPLYVGIEEKIFEQHGLRVEPVKFESTNQLMEALISGRIDASFGGVNNYVLLTIEEKTASEYKIISLASETTNAPWVFMLIRKDSEIKKIEQLKGKKIGVFPGSFAKAIYKKMIENYLDLQEVELVQMNANLELQALESGQVDAVIVLEPLAAVGHDRSISKTLDNALFANYFFDKMPVTASVISSRFLLENKETANKLIMANNQIINYINNNSTNTKKYIAKYTILEQDILDKISLPVFERLNTDNKQRLQKLSDLFYEEELLEKKIDVKNLLIYD